MTLAREIQSSFQEYLKSNRQENPGTDLSVTVLTTRFWPGYKSHDLNLPSELVRRKYSLFSSRMILIMDNNSIFAPYCRSSAYKRSKYFMKQHHLVESSHGFIHLVPALSMRSLEREP